MKTRNILACAATIVLAASLAIAGDTPTPAPAAAAVPAAAAPASLALGASIPALALELKNIDGKTLTLADVGSDKGTLVIFTCNACPYVKAWENRIAALGNDFAAKGVGVIAINSNDPAVNGEDDFAPMQKRAEQLKLTFPYVMDSTSAVARAFGATRTPEVFLFDGKGQLVYHGTIDDNAKEPSQVKARYLQDALDSLVAGKPIAVPETKALGCGIKFRKV